MVDMKSDQHAIESLRATLKPGDTVYTVLRHRSSSGMSRVIDLFVISIEEAGKPVPRCIGIFTARALGRKYDENKDGVKVSGTGMDMGFHLVYSLGRVLFDGDSRYSGRDPGYALTHRWL